MCKSVAASLVIALLTLSSSALAQSIAEQMRQMDILGDWAYGGCSGTGMRNRFAIDSKGIPTVTPLGPPYKDGAPFTIFSFNKLSQNTFQITRDLQISNAPSEKRTLFITYQVSPGFMQTIDSYDSTGRVIITNKISTYEQKPVALMERCSAPSQVDATKTGPDKENLGVKIRNEDDRSSGLHYVANTLPPDAYVSLRSEPSSSKGQRITTMPNGTAVKVLETLADGWWKVQVVSGGQVGWALSGQGHRKWITQERPVQEAQDTPGKISNRPAAATPISLPAQCGGVLENPDLFGIRTGLKANQISQLNAVGFRLTSTKEKYESKTYANDLNKLGIPALSNLERTDASFHVYLTGPHMGNRSNTVFAVAVEGFPIQGVSHAETGMESVKKKYGCPSKIQGTEALWNVPANSGINASNIISLLYLNNPGAEIFPPEVANLKTPVVYAGVVTFYNVTAKIYIVDVPLAVDNFREFKAAQNRELMQKKQEEINRVRQQPSPF